MEPAHDQTIPDEEWWFKEWSEFEDFVGIGHDRVISLSISLEGKTSPYIINRLLKANGLPHGPTNTMDKGLQCGVCRFILYSNPAAYPCVPCDGCVDGSDFEPAS